MMETFSLRGTPRMTPEVVDGCRLVGDFASRRLVGHSLTRPRWRYLQGAECIVVAQRPRLLGIAAYRRVETDVRVVLEFLIHRDLGEVEATIVTETLVSAVEAIALSDCIHCLMFMLWPDVRRKPFERKGYRAVVVDPYLAWLQKTLGQGSCVPAYSQQLH